MHTHIYPLFMIFFPFRSPQNTEESSLGYTVCSHQLSILSIVSIMYMSQSQSPNSSHPSTFSPLLSNVCSLCVCLYFCFAYKIIYTFFLDPTQMHSYIIFVFSVWLTSLCMTVSRSMDVNFLIAEWHKHMTPASCDLQVLFEDDDFHKLQIKDIYRC